MAEDAARSRLGRGLAALIGDVGAETASRAARAASAGCRSSSLRAQSAQSAHARSPTPSSTSSRPRSASAASSSRSWCAPCAAPTTFRDHRRRAALARGAARRPARGAGRRPRGHRRRGARACDHRERAARRSQCARRGERLSARSTTSSTYSQDDIAKIVGKSRSHVANTLRLLKLSDAVKAYIRSRQAHRRARAHAGRPAERRRAGAKRSSRAVSTCARSRRWRASARSRTGKNAGTAASARSRPKDADTLALEKRLSDALGLVVSIDHRGDGGMLPIRYRTLEQLDDVVRRLERGH